WSSVAAEGGGEGGSHGLDDATHGARVRRCVASAARAPQAAASADQGAGVSGAVVARAAFRDRDGKELKPSMRQQPSDYNPSYYRAGQRRVRRDQDAVRRMIAKQDERHPYKHGFDEKLWLDLTLEELVQATPTDPAQLRLCTETVRLPDGVRAVFKQDNIGEAILELMQRTGSHLQAIPVSRDGTRETGEDDAILHGYAAGFQSLSLRGTPPENDAAINLLPEMFDAIKLGDENASKSLHDYRLVMDETDKFGSRVVPHEPESSDEVDDSDAMYRGQQVNLEKAAPKAASSGINSLNSHDSNDQPVSIRSYWRYRAPSLKSIFTSTAKKDELGTPGSDLSTPSTAISLKIGRPLRPSTTAFTDRILTLTRLPPRLIGKRIRKEAPAPVTPQTDTIQQQVTAELLVCFTDPTMATYVNHAAVTLAIGFCVKRSDYAAARAIIKALQENQSYELTTVAFDILLDSAAAKADAHNFRLWMRKMIARGLKASARTWTSLHRLVCIRYPGREASERVIRAMQANGALSNLKVLQEVVKTRVLREFEQYLSRSDNETSLEGFLKLYDDKYCFESGHEETRQARAAKHYHPWLTNTTANIMAKELLLRGRTQEALALVTISEDSGLKVRNDTLSTYLAAAARARDPGMAISVLMHFQPVFIRDRGAVRLDALTYGLLFGIAWRKSCYNMMRVIWRYACCAGEVDWSMQRRVRDSLVEYLPAGGSHMQLEVKEDRRKLATETRKLLGNQTKRTEDVHDEDMEEDWYVGRAQARFGWAGKFVVGVAEGLPAVQTTTTRQPISLRAELLTLSAQPRTITPPSGEDAPSQTTLSAHKDRETRLKALLAADMHETFSLRPTATLPDLLERAWRQDMQWKASGIGFAKEAGRDGEVAEVQRTAKLAEMLGVMLDQGIHVPVEVGSAVR
ncbi:hypothetical protein LTR53_015207, partial [Teratosphaeriaceae sp. CCFEE 6253]